MLDKMKQCQDTLLTQQKPHGQSSEPEQAFDMGLESFSRQELWDIIQYQQQVFGLVAHDLRSPVATLQTYLNFILQHQDLDPANQQVFQELQRRSENTHALMDDLLEWARTGMQGQSQYQKVLLKEFGEGFLSHFEPEASRRAITLEHGQLPEIHRQFDTQLAKNCLRNFIHNSFKHTPEGGSILLHIEEAEHHTDFIVEDTGTGFPEATLKALNKGTHVPEDNKTSQISYGMGLMLCKTLLKKERGAMRWENRLNAAAEVCGARAILRLPMH